MVARTIVAATKTAVVQDVVYIAWIFRLDIASDPVLVWTGPRDIAFSGTADAALNGLTFASLPYVGEIGNIVEGRNGSQALSLRLPGVRLDDDALLQIVRDKRRWQFRQAWVWLATLDANYAIIGEPFRVKTGRMDRMNIGKGRNSGYVNLVIESHQAYASQVGNRKYSELKDFDPTDTSQIYVHDLANRQAIIGGTSATNPTNTTQAVAANSGFSGGRTTGRLDLL